VVVQGACDSVCPTSCYDAAHQCCHPSCRTCEGSADYCTTCMNGLDPVDGQCPQPHPDQDLVASRAGGELVGFYEAAYFPGFSTCWVEMRPGSYAMGYALDGKYCCRKIGQLSADVDACLTGCGVPPPESSGNFAVLLGQQVLPGKRCFTDCYYLTK